MSELFIRVRTREQYTEVLRSHLADAIITDPALADEKSDGRPVFLALPQVARESRADMVMALVEKAKALGGIMVTSIDELGMLDEAGFSGKVIADYFLYAYSSEAVHYYNALRKDMIFTASEELTDEEMQGVVMDSGQRFLYRIYGRVRLMTTAQKLEFQTFKNRQGERFISDWDDDFEYSVIYSAEPVDMTDRLPDRMFGGWLAEFTFESASETRKVLQAIKALKSGVQPGSSRPHERGHHFKGVE